MKFKNLFIAILSVFLLSVMLISCGGSGNSSDVSEEDDSFNIDNISVIKVQPSSSVFKSGHEGTVTVTVKSVESADAKDVPVSIIFLKNDENGEEQHYAGTYVIPVVTPGEDDYELKINVPSIEGEFGSYNIIACLYEKLLNQYTNNGNPTDEEIEVNIDDNNDIVTIGDVDLDPSLQMEPDVQIKKNLINDDVIILKTNSISPADPEKLSIAVQLTLIALASDVTDAKARFYISHLDGSQKYDIQVKDADGNPVDEVDLPDLIKYIDTEKGYELVVPDAVRLPLIEYVKYGTSSRYPFVVGVTVTSESEPEEFRLNNSAIANFWLVPDDSLLPVITSGKKIGFGLKRFFGNSYIGTGVDIYSYTGIDKDKVYSEHGFTMPMKLLKFGFNFFEASLNIRGYFEGDSTDGKEPGIHVSVKRINSTTNFPGIGYVSYSYDNDAYAEWKTEGIKDGRDILDVLCYGEPASNGTIELNPFVGELAPKGDTDYSTSASYSYSTTVMAGPIPITFTLGILGYAGVGAFVIYEEVNLAAGLIPYCGLDATAEGGVGVPGFQAGSGAELDLIQLGLNNYVWTNWEDDKDSENNPVKIVSLNEYSGLEIDLLHGRIYVFAEYPWPKFKKVMGRKIFVGFCTKRAEKNLWRTSGWCFTQHYPILPIKEYNISIPLN